MILSVGTHIPHPWPHSGIGVFWKLKSLSNENMLQWIVLQCMHIFMHGRQYAEQYVYNTYIAYLVKYFVYKNMLHEHILSHTVSTNRRCNCYIDNLFTEKMRLNSPMTIIQSNHQRPPNTDSEYIQCKSRHLWSALATKQNVWKNDILQ